MSQTPVPLRFHWNGRALEALRGDTIAAALWRHRIVALGVSRKRHRPLGLSGAHLQGVLVQVDGEPHVRADERWVSEGMDVRQQNLWPSAGIDLLGLLRFVPERWTRGGFERSMMFPGGSLRFAVWERMLMFLAGEVSLDPVRDREPASGAGRRLDVDVAVVGGGPAGIEAANKAAVAGSRVALISRGATLARTAAGFGVETPALHSEVTALLRHAAVGVYRTGRVVLAAPLESNCPATVIATRDLVLAEGKRSFAPLVPGHDLPGVIDAATAIALAPRLRGAMRRTVVLGTGRESMVALALERHAVPVVGVDAASALRRVGGRRRVESASLGEETIACETLVHAGPWRSDPSLSFQSRAAGSLRLEAGALPPHVRIAGAAALADEDVLLGPLAALADVAVCPCMDVTVAALESALRSDGIHPELLKRRTSCGMGPCQGFPCWELMNAVTRALTGEEAADRPTHRAPRRGITVEQAAGLDGLLELDP